MKVAVLFDRLGQYHIARLSAAAKYLQIVPIEICGQSKEYLWDKVENPSFLNRVTLFEDRDSAGLSSMEISTKLSSALNDIAPDVVAINGWSDKSALSALKWSKKNHVPTVLMSESAEQDEARIFWKELIKKSIVNQFGSALVGGVRHRDYLLKLGFPSDSIFTGYDVVDNNHFIKRSDLARTEHEKVRNTFKLPEEYFVVVSRFIEKKNLPHLLKSYHAYTKKAEKPWHLVILGDGHLKDELLRLVESLQLKSLVHLTGFKQYYELPVYFGMANAFVHVSTVEQWGLVVNEAMASGLPVIVSESCGCTPELVKDGVNGYVVDPFNQDQLTERMVSISDEPSIAKMMGMESRRIIAKYDSDSFGDGLNRAAHAAVRANKSQQSTISKIILSALTSR